MDAPHFLFVVHSTQIDAKDFNSLPVFNATLSVRMAARLRLGGGLSDKKGF
jgi:hypothetical protein